MRKTWACSLSTWGMLVGGSLWAALAVGLLGIYGWWVSQGGDVRLPEETAQDKGIVALFIAAAGVTLAFWVCWVKLRQETWGPQGHGYDTVFWLSLSALGVLPGLLFLGFVPGMGLYAGFMMAVCGPVVGWMLLGSAVPYVWKATFGLSGKVLLFVVIGLGSLSMLALSVWVIRGQVSRAIS